jgi:hypothetical protein
MLIITVLSVPEVCIVTATVFYCAVFMDTSRYTRGKQKFSGLGKCNNFRSTLVTDVDDTLQSSPLWSFKPVPAPLPLLEASLEPSVAKRSSNARDSATIAAIFSNFSPFN